ncbi:MAG: translation initiation factor eIF-1A [Candidatus Aenigmatarchaeota archaeon]|nr:MAG: translation initiation factor eIF-1A [Candidatus Aenigmarchaeota archaeon]
MEEGTVRVRMPRGDEVLGTVTEVLGGSRFRVECADGRKRMCRVPGRSKRKMYVKIGDVILVKPWSIEGDEKGDIVWRYKPAQVSWLTRNGFLNQ